MSAKCSAHLLAPRRHIRETLAAAGIDLAIGIGIGIDIVIVS